MGRESVVGGTVTRQIVFTPKAAKPPPTCSQAVKAGGLVFVSGTSIRPRARAPSCLCVSLA